MTNYYSELTQLFDAWRTRWTEQYRTYQILPLEVANAFQTFLGCREYFDEDGMTGTKGLGTFRQQKQFGTKSKVYSA